MKKTILFSIIIGTLLLWTAVPYFAKAEDDEYENETEYEDQYENQIPETETQPVQPPTETPPPAETPKPVVNEPKAEIKKVEKIIQETKTIVPPIIIKDDNENGIVDEIEQLYSK
jgi:hypothetical protein